MSVSSAHCKRYLSVQMLEASLFMGVMPHQGICNRYNSMIIIIVTNCFLILLYSCSQCLQTNNACGWCIYNKVCSGTADPCLSVNGTDTAYLQV